MGDILLTMARTVWSNDSGLQNEIAEALQVLPRAARPSFEWIKKQISLAPDQDWEDEEVRRLNIEDIHEKAKRRAKKTGLLNERSKPTSRTSASASIGQMYMTLENVGELVSATRIKFWGTRKPPFPKTHEGHSEALQWFTEASEEYRRTVKDTPADLTVTVTFRAANYDHDTHDHIRGPLIADALEDEDGRLVFAPGAAEAFLANLSEMASSGDALTIRHIERIKYVVPKLHVPKPGGGSDAFYAFEGSTLGELLNDVNSIVERSGWWKQPNALGHILFDLTPRHEVKWNSHNSFTDALEIILTVKGPATEEEVLRAYCDALKSLELKPVSLTEQQRGLLQLVYRTPNTPWPERFKVWNDWCNLHKGAFTPYQNWRALFSSYKSASRRAAKGWGQKEESGLENP